MQLYDVKVRLYGSLLNEVRREEVTAAEVVLLRFVHGADAVVDITPLRDERGLLRKSTLKDREERLRLAEAYTLGLNLSENPDDMPGAHLVRKVFGVEGVPLPQTIDDPSVDEDEVVEPAAPQVKTVRRAAPAIPKIEAADLMA